VERFTKQSEPPSNDDDDDDDDSDHGEIEYGEGQDDRISSLDESALVLDNTGQDKGCRPADMAFYDPYLQDGPAEAKFKGSYRCTGMFDTTMSGRALPPHFILLTDAKPENQGVEGAGFVENMHRIVSDTVFEPGFFDKDADSFLPSWCTMLLLGLRRLK
jgi:hypothetical protein